MTETAHFFLPILLLLILASLVGAAILVVSGWILPGLLKPDNPVKHKLTPYECGAPPVQEGARHRYSVKFYLVAMLFILFDIEIVFMYPWAVVYRDFLGRQGGVLIFWSMLSFVGILTVGYVYAIKKGALDWKK